MTFGRCYSPKTGRGYLGTVRSKKRVVRISEAISSETSRNKTLLDQETVVGKLNRMMVGWANYFCLGPVSKSLPGRRTTCPEEAAAVAVCQAQSAVAGYRAVSGIGLA